MPPTDVPGGDAPTLAGDTSDPFRPAALPSPWFEVGVVGEGGMGRVLRVHDMELDRPAALKVLRASLAQDATARARFEREARLTAQLDHPGVPTVLARGELADGRLYYVMRLVQGQPLDVALHGVGLRARVEVLRRLAEVVACAHQEGVVHRDIKPGNVLLGNFGEVVLLDWGLAVREGEADRPDVTLEEELVVPEVVGTPAWMAPERIRGEPSGPASDVYALGALLYLALADRAPVAARADLSSALRASAALDVPPGPALLTELCAVAMDVDPQRRPTAGAFVGALADWLAGTRLAPRAEERRLEAEQHLAEAADLEERARALDREARALLDGVPAWAPEAHKKRGWEVQGQAREAQQQALRHTELAVHALHVARSLTPDDPVIRDLLVEHHRRRAMEAARRGDHQAVSDHRAQLRVLGVTEATSGVPLDLADLPDGVRVLRTPLVRTLRRFRRGTPQDLGRTPMPAVRIPEGPCVLHLIAGDRAPVRVPLAARLGESWPARPPPEGRRLSLPAAVPDGSCLVPAGWLRVDPDALALDPLPPLEVWLDAFVVQEHPVTHRRYLDFLHAVVAREGADAAFALAPRWVSGPDADALLYRFDGARFTLDPDQPLTVHLDQPAVLVDWHQAMQFARFEGDRTGIAWRLPHELEWMRAAGVELGWAFPWGPEDDPAWYCMQASHSGVPTSAPVDAFPVDESVFGVRQLAGNVREWCLNTYRRQGPEPGVVIDPTAPGEGLRVIRGGAWTSSSAFNRIQSRFAGPPEQRMSALGFRLAASLEVVDRRP